MPFKQDTKGLNRPNACLQVTVVSTVIGIFFVSFFILSGQQKYHSISNVSKTTESDASRLENHNSFYYSNKSISFSGIDLLHESRKKRAVVKPRPDPTPKRKGPHKNKKRRKKKKQVIVINLFSNYHAGKYSKKVRNKNYKFGPTFNGDWDPGTETSEEGVGRHKSRKNKNRHPGADFENFADSNDTQEIEYSHGPNSQGRITNITKTWIYDGKKRPSKQNEMHLSHRKHHKKSNRTGNKHHSRQRHRKYNHHISTFIFDPSQELTKSGSEEDDENSYGNEKHTSSRNNFSERRSEKHEQSRHYNSHKHKNHDYSDEPNIFDGFESDTIEEEDTHIEQIKDNENKTSPTSHEEVNVNDNSKKPVPENPTESNEYLDYSTTTEKSFNTLHTDATSTTLSSTESYVSTEVTSHGLAISETISPQLNNLSDEYKSDLHGDKTNQAKTQSSETIVSGSNVIFDTTPTSQTTTDLMQTSEYVLETGDGTTAERNHKYSSETKDNNHNQGQHSDKGNAKKHKTHHKKHPETDASNVKYTSEGTQKEDDSYTKKYNKLYDENRDIQNENNTKSAAEFMPQKQGQINPTTEDVTEFTTETSNFQDTPISTEMPEEAMTIRTGAGNAKTKGTAEYNIHDMDKEMATTNGDILSTGRDKFKAYTKNIYAESTNEESTGVYAKLKTKKVDTQNSDESYEHVKYIATSKAVSTTDIGNRSIAKNKPDMYSDEESQEKITKVKGEIESITTGSLQELTKIEFTSETSDRFSRDVYSTSEDLLRELSTNFYNMEPTTGVMDSSDERQRRQGITNSNLKPITEILNHEFRTESLQLSKTDSDGDINHASENRELKPKTYDVDFTTEIREGDMHINEKIKTFTADNSDQSSTTKTDLIQFSNGIHNQQKTPGKDEVDGTSMHLVEESIPNQFNIESTTGYRKQGINNKRSDTQSSDESAEHENPIAKSKLNSATKTNEETLTSTKFHFGITTELRDPLNTTTADNIQSGEESLKQKNITNSKVDSATEIGDREYTTKTFGLELTTESMDCSASTNQGDEQSSHSSKEHGTDRVEPTTEVRSLDLTTKSHDVDISTDSWYRSTTTKKFVMQSSDESQEKLKTTAKADLDSTSEQLFSKSAINNINTESIGKNKNQQISTIKNDMDSSHESVEHDKTIVQSKVIYTADDRVFTTMNHDRDITTENWDSSTSRKLGDVQSMHSNKKDGKAEDESNATPVTEVENLEITTNNSDLKYKTKSLHRSTTTKKVVMLPDNESQEKLTTTADAGLDLTSEKPYPLFTTKNTKTESRGTNDNRTISTTQSDMDSSHGSVEQENIIVGKKLTLTTEGWEFTSIKHEKSFTTESHDRSTSTNQGDEKSNNIIKDHDKDGSTVNPTTELQNLDLTTTNPDVVFFTDSCHRSTTIKNNAMQSSEENQENFKTTAKADFDSISQKLPLSFTTMNTNTESIGKNTSQFSAVQSDVDESHENINTSVKSKVISTTEGRELSTTQHDTDFTTDIADSTTGTNQGNVQSSHSSKERENAIAESAVNPTTEVRSLDLTTKNHDVEISTDSWHSSSTTKKAVVQSSDESQEKFRTTVKAALDSISEKLPLSFTTMNTNTESIERNTSQFSAVQSDMDDSHENIKTSIKSKVISTTEGRELSTTQHDTDFTTDIVDRTTGTNQGNVQSSHSSKERENAIAESAVNPTTEVRSLDLTTKNHDVEISTDSWHSSSTTKKAVVQSSDESQEKFRTTVKAALDSTSEKRLFSTKNRKTEVRGNNDNKTIPTIQSDMDASHENEEHGKTIEPRKAIPTTDKNVFTTIQTDIDLTTDGRDSLTSTNHGHVQSSHSNKERKKTEVKRTTEVDNLELTTKNYDVEFTTETWHRSTPTKKVVMISDDESPEHLKTTPKAALDSTSETLFLSFTTNNTQTESSITNQNLPIATVKTDMDASHENVEQEKSIVISTTEDGQEHGTAKHKSVVQHSTEVRNVDWTTNSPEVEFTTKHWQQLTTTKHSIIQSSGESQEKLKTTEKDYVDSNTEKLVSEFTTSKFDVVFTTRSQGDVVINSNDNGIPMSQLHVTTENLFRKSEITNPQVGSDTGKHLDVEYDDGGQSQGNPTTAPLSPNRFEATSVDDELLKTSQYIPNQSVNKLDTTESKANYATNSIQHNDQKDDLQTNFDTQFSGENQKSLTNNYKNTGDKQDITESLKSSLSSEFEMSSSHVTAKKSNNESFKPSPQSLLEKSGDTSLEERFAALEPNDFHNPKAIYSEAGEPQPDNKSQTNDDNGNSQGSDAFLVQFEKTVPLSQNSTTDLLKPQVTKSVSTAKLGEVSDSFDDNNLVTTEIIQNLQSETTSNVANPNSAAGAAIHLIEDVTVVSLKPDQLNSNEEKFTISEPKVSSLPTHKIITNGAVESRNSNEHFNLRESTSPLQKDTGKIPVKSVNTKSLEDLERRRATSASNEEFWANGQGNNFLHGQVTPASKLEPNKHTKVVKNLENSEHDSGPVGSSNILNDKHIITTESNRLLHTANQPNQIMLDQGQYSGDKGQASRIEDLRFLDTPNIHQSAHYRVTTDINVYNGNSAEDLLISDVDLKDNLKDNSKSAELLSDVNDQYTDNEKKATGENARIYSGNDFVTETSQSRDDVSMESSLNPKSQTRSEVKKPSTSLDSSTITAVQQDNPQPAKPNPHSAAIDGVAVDNSIDPTHVSILATDKGSSDETELSKQKDSILSSKNHDDVQFQNTAINEELNRRDHPEDNVKDRTSSTFPASGINETPINHSSVSNSNAPDETEINSMTASSVNHLSSFQGLQNKVNDDKPSLDETDDDEAKVSELETSSVKYPDSKDTNENVFGQRFTSNEESDNNKSDLQHHGGSNLAALSDHDSDYHKLAEKHDYQEVEGRGQALNNKSRHDFEVGNKDSKGIGAHSPDEIYQYDIDTDDLAAKNASKMTNGSKHQRNRPVTESRNHSSSKHNLNQPHASDTAIHNHENFSHSDSNSTSKNPIKKQIEQLRKNVKNDVDETLDVLMNTTKMTDGAKRNREVIEDAASDPSQHNAVARAQGENSTVDALSVSKTGNDAIASAINGSEANSRAVSAGGNGNSMAASHTYGNDGATALALNEGNGTSLSSAASAGTGDAKSDALATNNNASSAALAENGGDAHSNAFTMENGHANSLAAAMEGGLSRSDAVANGTGDASSGSQSEGGGNSIATSRANNGSASSDSIAKDGGNSYSGALARDGDSQAQSVSMGNGGSRAESLAEGKGNSSAKAFQKGKNGGTHQEMLSYARNSSGSKPNPSTFWKTTKPEKIDDEKEDRRSIVNVDA